MNVTVPIPPNWMSKGLFPPIDVDALENSPDPSFLREDIFFAESPDGRFRVDVTWTKDQEGKGFYLCRLVEWDDWSEPVSLIQTRSTMIAAAWAGHTAAHVHHLIA